VTSSSDRTDSSALKRCRPAIPTDTRRHRPRRPAPATAHFSLSADHGAAGELRVPGAPSDSSVLQISNSSKLLIDLREDALAVMENWCSENTSDKIFQAGPAGLAVPLPAGRQQSGPSRAARTWNFRRVRPCSCARRFRTQCARDPSAGSLRVLPAHYRRRQHHHSPAHAAWNRNPVLMVPESHHLKLEAPGLQAMAPQTDDRGAGMQIFQLASVPRNGVLTLTVSGLPTRASLGKTIATVLVAALVFAALLGLRRPRVEERSEDRRERIFGRTGPMSNEHGGPRDLTMRISQSGGVN